MRLSSSGWSLTYVHQQGSHVVRAASLDCFYGQSRARRGTPKLTETLWLDRLKVGVRNIYTEFNTHNAHHTLTFVFVSATHPEAASGLDSVVVQHSGACVTFRAPPNYPTHRNTTSKIPITYSAASRGENAFQSPSHPSKANLCVTISGSNGRIKETRGGKWTY